MSQDSRTRALTRANQLFRRSDVKEMTDYEKAEQSFHQNRERLKAERIAREAKSHPSAE